MSSATLETQQQQKFYRCPSCWVGFREDECNIVPDTIPDLSHVECPKCNVYFVQPVPSAFPPVEPRAMKIIPIVWLNGRRWQVDLDNLELRHDSPTHTIKFLHWEGRLIEQCLRSNLALNYNPLLGPHRFRVSLYDYAEKFPDLEEDYSLAIGPIRPI